MKEGSIYSRPFLGCRWEQGYVILAHQCVVYHKQIFRKTEIIAYIVAVMS